MIKHFLTKTQRRIYGLFVSPLCILLTVCGRFSVPKYNILPPYTSLALENKFNERVKRGYFGTINELEFA